MTDISSEEPPGGGGRRGPLTRRGRVVLGVVAVLLVVGLGGGLWVLRQVDPAGGPGAKVTVDVEPGTSVAGVAARLDAKGVISSARIFRIYLKLTGGIGTVQAGEYELQKNLSMGAARAALKRGPSIRFEKLTVPEGLTLEQIADRVGAVPGRSKERFLAAARSGGVRSKWQPPGNTSLEGLLFPDTYLATDNEDETAIIRRMVDRFDQVADEVGLAAAPNSGTSGPTRLSPYQLIVGASLVESEAKVPEDRPLIASVISNRLEKGMKLQIDATVLYALGEHKDRVLNKDLEIDSPYNTYKVDGLPPTPISAPGRAALEAMLHPADTTFLYYVLSDRNGKHAFATTPSEFDALKAEAHRKGLL
ncbi:MAG TPA: endolytic transglycosylase MltG [Acidimicrobiia bacterium]|nr:endolytic transglycosylase MltG [Acidimicrobiia bacterium]